MHRTRVAEKFFEWHLSVRGIMLDVYLVGVGSMKKLGVYLVKLQVKRFLRDL